MGCGTSKEARNPPLPQIERDPSDYNLEYVELQPVQLVEFDLTFQRIEGVLNRLIELNNDVNDCLADVKAAYALCSSDSLLLRSQMGVPDHDHILLSLVYKASGALPTPQEIQSLLCTNPALPSLDAALEKARQDLHSYLATTPIHLRVTEEGCLLPAEESTPPPPHLDHFNSALSTFRSATGSTFKTLVQVKPSLAPLSQTVGAQVLKRKGVNGPDGPKWQSLRTEELQLEPATLLDMLGSNQGQRMKRAEVALADRAVRLAFVAKDLSEMKWQALRNHKITIAVAIADPDKRAAVRRALVDVNQVLFSLVCSTSASQGTVDMAVAVAEVARQLCQAIKERWRPQGGLPLYLKSLLKFTPSLQFKDAGIFNFSINAEVMPAAQMTPFPFCLAPQGQDLLLKVEILGNTIANALQALPGISAELDPLMEQARHFYELVPEAAAAKGMPMMEAARAGKMVGANLKVLFDSQEIFTALAGNIKRIADDLADAPAEVARVLADEAQSGPQPTESETERGTPSTATEDPLPR